MVWRKYIPRPKGYFTLYELEKQVPARRAGAPLSGSMHAKSLLPPVEPEEPEPEVLPDPEELKAKGKELFKNESPKRRYHREMRAFMYKLDPKNFLYALDEFERADPMGALRSTREASGRIDVFHLRKHLQTSLEKILKLLRREGVEIQVEWRAGHGMKIRTISEADAERLIRDFHFERGLKLLPKSNSSLRPKARSSQTSG